MELEADVISIDTLTSSEEQAVRSIRSSPEMLSPHDCSSIEEALLSDLEQFRLHAMQSITASLDQVIFNVARSVLGRELQLTAAEMQPLIQREMRRFEREGPLRLRVSPSHVRLVRTELPIVADSTLDAGALVLELRDGSTHSRLPVRLGCAVDRLLNPSVSSLHGEVAPGVSP